MLHPYQRPQLQHYGAISTRTLGQSGGDSDGVSQSSGNESPSDTIGGGNNGGGSGGSGGSGG